MEAYLFVHFREKETTDGEQVYFALSKDGFHWEQVNDGKPVLWSKMGDKGVRDHTIIRTKDNKFFILATDLSLAGCYKTKYKSNWVNIARYGSKSLSLWESDDLIHWSPQRMITLGNDDFGCLWAPDIIYDKENNDYVIHWSSAHVSDNYKNKAIYYTRTKDFVNFTKAELMYRKEDSGVIDSAIYEENGTYYRFLKSEGNPTAVILQKGKELTGTYTRIDAFDNEMQKLESAAYEAPTAFQLANGKWCLMLDFFGVRGDGQGYVPFIADDLASGRFIRSEEAFSFPYGFKHGTVLSITGEEYNHIKDRKVTD